jgi:chemotaxis response regulator CheB
MRVAIVNDLDMAVEGLRRAVSSTGENQVAWIAQNGVEAVERCAQDVPDLILMDLIMPEMNGVEATEKIMQSTPCPILIVTASVNQNSSMVFEAMGKGALDAISTPLFSGNGQTEASESLLRKVSMLGVLSKPPVDPDKTVIDFQYLEADTENQLVVIGSSSGGPMALSQLLSGIPADFPAGIVIVQHVDEQFSYGLADWLNQMSILPVKIVKSGDKPKKGQVLLAGTNDHLVMNQEGILIYQEEPKEMPYRPSVDVFWHSLCKNWKGDISAVLLTGMGRDGAQGMLELGKRGAYTIAQDEQSCAVYGMPKAAVELNAAKEVADLRDIANKLCERYKSRLVTSK